MLTFHTSLLARRLYGVLDKHLGDNKADFLVGNKLTIVSLSPVRISKPADATKADIAHWGWVSAAGWAGVDINEFPNLKAWEERVWALPAVQRGANVPDPYKMKELLADKEAMERHAAQSKAWIQQGMKSDAQKKL